MPIDTEMGEYLIGSYLSLVEGCDFVVYNVHPPGGKMKGLDEIDVVGLNFKEAVGFVCEVTTHITGLLYTNYDTTYKRIIDKLNRQRDYAKSCLGFFREHRFMFWSPVVSSGLVTRLKNINGLEFVINEDYAERIKILRGKAKEFSHDTGNPAFRLLQILEHVRT